MIEYLYSLSVWAETKTAKINNHCEK